MTRSDGDQDVRWWVRFNDPAIQIATPANVALTPQQKKCLNTWKFGPATSNDNSCDQNMSNLIDDERAAGGANLNEIYLMVKLEGRRNQPIFVDDVRPITIQRTLPYDGTLINIPPQNGGQTFNMIFNFDEFDPRAREVHTTDHLRDLPGDLFFNHHTITVRDAEQDAILLKAITTRTAVTFQIQISYHLGGQSKTLIINNRGKPFALTPFNCSKRVKLAPGIDPTVDVTYQDIWELNGDDRVTQVHNPQRYPIDGNFCAVGP